MGLPGPFDPHSQQAGKGGYLLAFGSVSAPKNVAMLLEAMKARKGKPMPLVLVGSRNACIYGDTGITASANVRFTGRVNDAELCALYGNAFLFLLPSLTEGYGLPAGEAMSFGCPIIASTGGALPDVYGDMALLLDPLDAGSWARAIDEMVADDGIRQRWVESGRIHVGRSSWAISSLTLLTTIGAVET